MKRIIYSGRQRKNEYIGAKRKSGICAADIAAVALALFCAVGFIVTSLGQGSEDSAIPAAITYTPPEKAKEKSFWDIFSENAADFFRLFGYASENDGARDANNVFGGSA